MDPRTIPAGNPAWYGIFVYLIAASEDTDSVGIRVGIPSAAAACCGCLFR